MRQPQREALAAVLRRAIEAMMSRDIPVEQLTDTTDELTAVVDKLEDGPPRPPKPLQMPDLSDVKSAFADDPIVGPGNPIAPPVNIAIRDGLVVGTVRFGRAHEGAPGFVHGGTLAAVFDQVLGLANLVNGHPGMTGTLTVRYLRATPIGRDVRFEARAESTNGRKSFVRGRALVDDAVTAEAEGTFVAPSARRAAEMFVDRS
jgi:acyl-coenzyme A thioesterase PaaI-like protein